MRAVVFSSFGDESVLSVADVDLPKIGPGQVLIRVEAAAVNPADLAARSGAFGPLTPPGPAVQDRHAPGPAVPARHVTGWDVAGIVAETAPDVTAFAEGDSVVGMSDWLITRAGTHAEHVTLDAAALALAPFSVPSVEAATLPANALTATQALDLLALTRGDLLVVTGAGGAVGGYAVELALLRGLRVIGVGSAQDEPFVTALGADFVTRSAQAYAATVRADGLLDTATVGAPALRAVRDGGAYVGVRAPSTPAPERGIRVDTVAVHSDGAALRRLVSLVDDDRLTLRVADTFAFEDAGAAHALLARPGTRGRPVLLP